MPIHTFIHSVALPFIHIVTELVTVISTLAHLDYSLAGDLSAKVNSNSNSSFIVLNAYPKTDSNQRHSRSHCHGERPGKRQNLVLVCFCKEIIFELLSERVERMYIIRQIIPNLSRLMYRCGKAWDLKQHTTGLASTRIIHTMSRFKKRFKIFRITTL